MAAGNATAMAVRPPVSAAVARDGVARWHRRCCSRMRYRNDRTASATADYIVLEPVPASDVARRAVRVAATAGLLVVFGYCGYTAWGVLQGLGRVSLADMAQALRIVTVRDAILCLVGYRVGRELVTALLQRRGAR